MIQQMKIFSYKSRYEIRLALISECTCVYQTTHLFFHVRTIRIKIKNDTQAISNRVSTVVVDDYEINAILKILLTYLKQQK